MKVEIRAVSDLRVAAVRHLGPYEGIGQAFERLQPLAANAGFDRAPDAKLVALYHDDPRATPEAKLRSEAGVTVAPDAVISGPLSEQRVHGGRHAVTVYRGSYEGLPNAWAELLEKWLPKSGDRRRGTLTWELYRNTPGQVAREDLVTELYVPLEG